MKLGASDVAEQFASGSIVTSCGIHFVIEQAQVDDPCQMGSSGSDATDGGTRRKIAGHRWLLGDQDPRLAVWADEGCESARQLKLVARQATGIRYKRAARARSQLPDLLNPSKRGPRQRGS